MGPSSDWKRKPPVQASPGGICSVRGTLIMIAGMMASLTMPTTPKASTARRDFSFGDAVKGGLAKVPAQPAVGSVSMDESEDHDLDG